MALGAMEIMRFFYVISVSNNGKITIKGVGKAIHRFVM